MKRKGMFCVVLTLFSLPLGAGNRGVVRAVKAIPNQYIVVLESNVPNSQVLAVAENLIGEHGGKLRLLMNNAAPIFSVEMTPQQAERLARHPFVLQVEENGPVYLSAVQSLPPVAPLNWMDLWNLDRIDQWGVANSNAYQYCERAHDVTAYIVDSGVMGDHQEFRRPDGTSRPPRTTRLVPHATPHLRVWPTATTPLLRRAALPAQPASSRLVGRADVW